MLSLHEATGKGSIAFHRHMGFDILSGDANIDGIPVTSNYDGRDGAKIYQLRKEAGTQSSPG